MNLNWLPDLTQGSGPKYRVLANALEDAIRDGRLSTGTKLPPVRELAWQLQITPGTVARAYQIGIDDGVLEAAVGRGTFVKSRERGTPDLPINPIAAHPALPEGAINLRTASTPDVGQDTLIKALLTELAADDGLSLVNYVHAGTDRPARAAAIEWLATHDVRGEVDDVVLTYGAQQAIVTALHATLNRNAPVVLSDMLIYPGFRQAARLLNAQLYGVAGDDQGMLPDALDAACRRYHPQAIVLSPTAHNPTTVQMSEARRGEIALIARRHDIQIIEDDVYGYVGKSRLPGMGHFCPERVWLASSLSKCGASGLRVGFLLAPPGKGATARGVVQSLNYSISALLASLTEKLIRQGHALRLRDRVHAENFKRLKLTVNMLGRWNIHWNEHASFIWLGLPEGWRSSEFAQACEQNQVLIAAADVFATQQNAATNAVRLSLGGTHDIDRFREALEVVDGLLSRPARALVI